MPPASPIINPDQVALRTARRLLQLGAVFIVLASLPSALFDLERHQFPKEIVLHLAAGAAALAALRAVRRLELGLADILLVGYVVLSLLSAALATNYWLAFRAAGVTLSGVAAFWTARAVSRGGLGHALLVAVAGAAVLGAITGLLQAYGVDLPLTASTRAPGGTFGNRNFMAHVVAIALPSLMLLTLETRSRTRVLLGYAGMAIAAAALMLSRSRAGWLGAAIPAAFFAVAVIRQGRLPPEPRLRGRLAGILGAVGVGLMLALFLPNRLEWKSNSPYLESLVGVANYRDGSGHGRLVQYRNTLRMAREHPAAGVGPGNWPVAYPRYTTPGDPAFDPGDIMPTNPWPSSDWVAIAAERGFPALLLLAAAFGVLVIAGYRRSRAELALPERLAGAALASTTIAVGVVGSFDAVLLLAAPSLLIWTALGALTPPMRAFTGFELSRGRRRLLGGAVAFAATVFALRSAAQAGAMLLAGSGRSVRMVRWATRLDPGSYRLHMLLAGTPSARGPCTRIRVHALAAHTLFPDHSAPIILLRSCGIRLPRHDD